jgi:WD40 repeat protein
VWDLQKGFSVKSIPAESKVNDLDFGRGYKVVVSAHMDKCVRIHDMTTGESIAKIQQHNGAVTSVFMCEGSNSILSNGRGSKGSRDEALQMAKICLFFTSDHVLHLFDVRYHGDPKVVQTYKDERYRNGCDWNAACMR